MNEVIKPSDQSIDSTHAAHSNHPMTENAMVHLMDYWRIFTKRWKMSLFIAILVSACGLFVTFNQPKEYTASIKLKIKSEDDESAISMTRAYYRRFDPTWLQNEFEAIRSKRILSKVIKELDLIDYFRKPQPTLLGNMSKSLGLEEHTLRNIIYFYRSKPENSKVQKPTQEQIEDMAFWRLKRMVSTQEARDTSLIELRITTVNDPVMAAQIANTIADVYAADKVNSKINDISKAIDVLKKRITSKEAELADAKAKVSDIRAEYQITTFSEDPIKQTNVAEIERLKGILAEARVELKVKKKTLEKLESMTNTQVEEALGIIVEDSQDYLVLKNELNRAVVDYKMLQVDYGQNHPDVVKARTRMEQLRKQMDERLEGIVSGFRLQMDKAQTRVDGLQQELDSMTNRFSGKNAQELQIFNDALKEVKKHEELLDALNKKVSQELINIELPRSGVEVFNAATTPRLPSSPRMLRQLLIILLLAAMAGVGFVFFLEYLDTSVKTVDEVENILKAQVLTVVPHKVGLISANPHLNTYDELYRILYTNLSFMNGNKGHQVVSVLSAGAGEGKSTTTANFGYVAAKSGKKVLIIDADIRRPVQHAFINAENNMGLYDILQGKITLNEAIHETSLENLSYIFAGSLKNNALGLLNPVLFKEMLASLKETYDLILIDCPPILGVNDASVLASLSDINIQVVKYQGYSRGILQRAANTLRSNTGRAPAVVLNNVNTKADNYYNHYYYTQSY